MYREILSLNNAPPKCIRQPGECTCFSKKRSSFASLSDYGKTMNEGCELLRFAPFCKTCQNTVCSLF